MNAVRSRSFSTLAILALATSPLLGCSSSSSGSNKSADGGGTGAGAGTGGAGVGTGGAGTATGGSGTGAGTGTGGTGASTGGAGTSTGGTAAGTGGTGTGAGGTDGGAGGADGGGYNGTGGVPAGMCDKSACDLCFKSPAPCGVTDNPCNDDAACDPKENAWIACICGANGDATKQATCDATFKTAGNVSADIVTCSHTSCNVCYGSAGLVCPVNSAACQTCLQTGCATEIGACSGDAACGAALSPLGKCVCDAQDGKGGSPTACEAAGTKAGGALFTAISACAKKNCATECAF